MNPIKDRVLAAVVHADMTNPISGMKPSFAFGDGFDALWQKLFAAVWALAIIGSIVMIIIGALKMSAAGDNMQMHTAGKSALMRAAIALLILVSLGAIVGLIMFLAG